MKEVGKEVGGYYKRYFRATEIRGIKILTDNFKYMYKYMSVSLLILLDYIE